MPIYFLRAVDRIYMTKEKEVRPRSQEAGLTGLQIIKEIKMLGVALSEVETSEKKTAQDVIGARNRVEVLKREIKVLYKTLESTDPELAKGWNYLRYKRLVPGQIDTHRRDLLMGRITKVDFLKYKDLYLDTLAKMSADPEVTRGVERLQRRKEYDRRYLEKNKEEILEYQREFHKKNRERDNANRRGRRENPEYRLSEKMQQLTPEAKK